MMDMNNMKYVALIALIGCAGFSVNAFAQDRLGLPDGYKLVDRVRATVDDKVITQYELDRAFEPLGGAGHGILDETEREAWYQAKRTEVLDELVNSELILSEGRKLSLEVSPQEVARYINNLKQQNSWDDAQLDAFVRRIGFRSLAGYQDHVEREMLKAQTIQYKTASKVRPSNDDIQRIFERDYHGGKFRIQVHAQHILIRLPQLVSGQKIRDLSQKAHRVRAMAMAEEKTFDELAAEFSDDSNAAAGGDLGWFGHCEMAPDFENEVFKLKAGQISEVVKTSFGYHIIRLLERRKVPLEDAAIAKRCIRMNLEIENRLKAYQNYVKELRVTHHVRQFN
ncbi:MAG: peptidyl-prolyl cis-trans isomerase SurA [Myxococcota bacterium]